jgi:hypothetical protein
VFAERLRVTTGNTTLSDEEFSTDNFFPGIDNLFRTSTWDTTPTLLLLPTTSAHIAPYVFLRFPFQSLLEFLVYAIPFVFFFILSRCNLFIYYVDLHV